MLAYWHASSKIIASSSAGRLTAATDAFETWEVGIGLVTWLAVIEFFFLRNREGIVPLNVTSGDADEKIMQRR